MERITGKGNATLKSVLCVLACSYTETRWIEPKAAADALHVYHQNSSSSFHDRNSPHALDISMGVPWLDQPVMLHSSRADKCKLTPEQCALRSSHWLYWYVD